ncbi:c-type cytochrome [bacterium]|nr:c-type cytochrome [bacterium]
MQGRRAAVVVSVLALIAATASAGGKNIQYYDKDMSLEDIKKEMRTLRRSLGTDCSHCHQMKPRDYSLDTDTKKTARNMLNMVDKINKDLFTKDALGIKEGDAPKASCFMCHKGKEKPEYKPEAKDADKEKKFQEAVKADKHKTMKAGMEKMMDKLNKNHFTKETLGIAKGDAPKATCWMCHRGEVEFSTKMPDDDGNDRDK